jgi:hypothetical protein
MTEIDEIVNPSRLRLTDVSYLIDEIVNPTLLQIDACVISRRTICTFLEVWRESYYH